jgi:AbrB family looped-hinge helix DNA binding protein
MPIATVTSKGQVTLPIELRNKLGIHTGTKLEIVENGDGSARLRPLKRKASSLAGYFGPHNGKPVSVEEMDDAIAAGAADSMRPEDDRP